VAGNSIESGRTVASKVFAVLDAFTGAGPTLRLVDIARRTGLPMPTASRLVGELVEWGGLERHGDGSYRIGERMWSVGSLSPCLRLHQELAGPLLQELAASTGRAAQLAVRRGPGALVVELATAPGAAPPPDHRGTLLPLHASAVGRILLAHAPAGVLDDVLDQGLRRITRHTVDSPARLAGQLSRIRADGVAVAHEELRLGEVAVAVPVRHPDLGVIAALGAVAPSATPLTRIEPAVRAAGARMEAAVAARAGGCSRTQRRA
jgi:IclR family transcriptional regulator, acetate operon repressor